MDYSNNRVVIELRNVKREFLVGEEIVHALRGVSFKIHEGEFVTIMGTSGSGKSTLLNQLGCLDTPSSGEYLLDGVPVRQMSRNQRAILRNRKISQMGCRRSLRQPLSFILRFHNIFAGSPRPGRASQDLSGRAFRSRR